MTADAPSLWKVSHVAPANMLKATGTQAENRSLRTGPEAGPRWGLAVTASRPVQTWRLGSFFHVPPCPVEYSREPLARQEVAAAAQAAFSEGCPPALSCPQGLRVRGSFRSLLFSTQLQSRVVS